MLTLYKALSEYGKNNLFKRAEVLENLIKKFKEDNLFVAKRLLDGFVMYYYSGMDISKKEDDAETLTKPMTFVKENHPSNHTRVNRCTPGLNLINIDQGSTKMRSVKPVEGSDTEYVVKHYPKVDLFIFIKLSHVLRTHRKELIGEEEVFFRDSFDELLDFVLLLIYYLRNEIITMREVNAHFQHYLMKLRENEALVSYIKVFYNWEDFEWLFKQLPRKEEKLPM